MEPFSHVVFALIPVLGYWVVRYRQLPSGSILFVVLFASLFPDLVDKPLAWTLGVIPSGRMLAHSLVIATPIILAVLALSWRIERLGHGGVFAWGYISHLIGDFYPVVTEGREYYWLPNMFWPLTGANPDRNPGFGDKLPELGVHLIPEIGVGVLLGSYIVFDMVRQWKSSR